MTTEPAPLRYNDYIFLLIQVLHCSANGLLLQKLAASRSFSYFHFGRACRRLPQQIIRLRVTPRDLNPFPDARVSRRQNANGNVQEDVDGGSLLIVARVNTNPRDEATVAAPVESQRGCAFSSFQRDCCPVRTRRSSTAGLFARVFF